MKLEDLKKKTIRKKVYKLALELACNDPRVDRGLCFYIFEALRWYELRYEDRITAVNFWPEKCLPEFYELKKFSVMDSYSGYWWPCTTEGWEIRIELFWDMIQEM